MGFGLWEAKMLWAQVMGVTLVVGFARELNLKNKLIA
jgi:hypothetical protein